MKCSVCGNEVNSNSTKCSVCGSNIDNSSLSRAMSNISSLANALKSKREVTNNTKAFEAELKKVATRAKDLEDLYTKDIELKTNDEDYQEDFDLNAFYEQARLDSLGEDADSETEHISNIEEEKDINIEVEETEQEEEFVEDETLDKEEEDEEQDVEEGDEVEPQEEFEELEEEDEVEEEYSEDEDHEDAEVVEEYSEEEESEEDDYEPVSLELEDSDEEENGWDTSNTVSGDFATGYIKESEIITEEANEESEVISNSIQAASNSEVEGEEIDFTFAPIDKSTTADTAAQDNSGFVDIEQQTNSADGDSEISSEFAPVKADDVPYTQVEETGNAGSDDKPIVIDSKDVVTANAEEGADVTIPTSDDNGSKKVKYNKFCARVAKFFLFNSLLVFAILALHYFVLKDLKETNVVFEFINTFLLTGYNWYYFAIGVLAAGALAILFSLFQFMFVKRRKPGAILFLLSVLITGLYVGGFYYIEMLMPIIEFVKYLISLI